MDQYCDSFTTVCHHVKYVHSTPDGDNLVAYMARVSNPDNQNNTETSARLIKYLIKHETLVTIRDGEHVSLRSRLLVVSQLKSFRHRSFSFQEFSQRYAKALDTPGPLAVRRQDTKNRQNSVDDIDPYTTQDFQIKADQVYDLSFKLYNEMLAALLKNHVKYYHSVHLHEYMNGTLRSWIHYTDLRCSNGTQLEHKFIVINAVI